jgi:branched-chain amino acid transport system ATP-binding protein
MNILRIDRLNKSFGSLTVTDDVSLAVGEGERHVIIGPNGAGKTSLINQVGGQLKPTSGCVLLRDRDITGASPERISRLGVGRTFQRNNLLRIYGSHCKYDTANRWTFLRRSQAAGDCPNAPRP